MYYECDSCSNDKVELDSGIKLGPSVEGLANECAVFPQCPWELGSRTLEDTKIHRRSSPLYRMVQHLHRTYAHPLFKSSLDNLQYLTHVNVV